MAIYTYVGLYRDYNANNNLESVAVVNVAKDGYSPKGKHNLGNYYAHLGTDQLHDTSIFGHGKLECPLTIKGGGTALRLWLSSMQSWSQRYNSW